MLQCVKRERCANGTRAHLLPEKQSGHSVSEMDTESIRRLIAFGLIFDQFVY
jgi:hypothetical protein